MKDRELREIEAGTGAAVVAAVSLLGLALCTVRPLCAQESTPEAESRAGQVIAAELEYKEVSYGSVHWGLAVLQKSEPFSKEPALSGGTVLRGILKLGGGASSEMALVWDRTAGKLYLDLNRNFDLTDDTGGMFPSQNGARYYSQTFAKVRLPFKSERGIRPMLVDMTLRDEGRLSCDLAMKSLWQGKVTLHGKEWQFGLLYRPMQQGPSLEPGDLLLRPWSEHAMAFSQVSDTGDVVPFPQKLFLDNHAYKLRCTEEGEGESAKVRVQLTELQPKLGEVKIPGAFIRRATFEGGGYQVVLDNPGETAKVPVGSYGSPKVFLQKGTTGAYLDRDFGASRQRINVNAKTPAVLEVGGPLTNCVSVMKRGRYLSLNYRLKGVGGDYRLAYQDRSHPPEFMVYRGDKKVASGRFEYG